MKGFKFIIIILSIFFTIGYGIAFFHIAKEFNIPFYIAAPNSTFDLTIKSGKEIPIEIRSEDEVLYINGLDDSGEIKSVRIASPGSNAFNPAFDVTPVHAITHGRK